jgi:hypothetical protein
MATMSELKGAVLQGEVTLSLVILLSLLFRRPIPLNIITAMVTSPVTTHDKKNLPVGVPGQCRYYDYPIMGARSGISNGLGQRVINDMGVLFSDSLRPR